MWGQLRSAEGGASAIEYCLLAALIALATVTAMQSVGAASMSTLDKVNDSWCAKHANGNGKGPAKCR
jgi:Flp pilus assembly pilin Flp